MLIPSFDKTAISVGALTDPPDETAFWLGKTPEERLIAVELIRRTVYGYGDSPSRLQRVLEVAQLRGG